jgi:hypothetical protein
MDVAAASATTVIVSPFSIRTASPATGNDAPAVPPALADQVEVAFQLPEATEYRFAAFAPE